VIQSLFSILLAIHLLLPSSLLPQGGVYSGSPGAGGAFNIVASCTTIARNSTSATQFSCTSTLNIPSGDGLIVHVDDGGCGSLPCVDSVCDTASSACSGATNTLTRAVDGYQSAWGAGSEIWVLCNTTANPTALLTVNTTTGNAFVEFSARLISGQKTSGCVDATATNTTGAGTAALTVAGITTAQAGEFVYEGYSLYSNATCTDSTYTILNPGSMTNTCDGYYVPSGTLSGATATASTGVTSQTFFNGLVVTIEHP
jgi:hypothetical protein